MMDLSSKLSQRFRHLHISIDFANALKELDGNKESLSSHYTLSSQVTANLAQDLTKNGTGDMVLSLISGSGFGAQTSYFYPWRRILEVHGSSFLAGMSNYNYPV
jgi:hypothetical protein